MSGPNSYPHSSLLSPRISRKYLLAEMLVQHREQQLDLFWKNRDERTLYQNLLFKPPAALENNLTHAYRDHGWITTICLTCFDAERFLFLFSNYSDVPHSPLDFELWVERWTKYAKTILTSNNLTCYSDFLELFRDGRHFFLGAQENNLVWEKIKEEMFKPAENEKDKQKKEFFINLCDREIVDACAATFIRLAIYFSEPQILDQFREINLI